MKTILILLLTINCFSLFAQSEVKLANEYFQQGDLQKAKILFEDLAKDKQSIPLIHSNYLNLMVSQKEFKEAFKYIDKVLRWYPQNIQYVVDNVWLFEQIADKEGKNKVVSDLLKNNQKNQYQLSLIAQNFTTRQLYPEAVSFYKKAREVSGRPFAFALDLAAIYRLQNNKKLMTAEYIYYAESNPSNLTYIKNLFQNILTQEEDQLYLEETLIKRIQQSPDKLIYIDLLIWLELQRKNFYAAFMQAKSLDRRNNQPGDECMRIGRIAFDNSAWEEAITIFEYVVTNYSNSYNYPIAKRSLIRSKENKIKSEYPVNKETIRSLASEYQSLFQELGPQAETLEALRNKALLHAFYLNELDTAIDILLKIISNRRSNNLLIAESKLDLGDMHLLNGEPWEATLLYSQVEKSNKESPLGYEAKLRNARLNYYTGNFALAKSHLDILKNATTRQISNDAIALSLLISDNTVFDTTDVVMKEFANIELLIFMNKDSIALDKLQTLITSYVNHSITDEAHWLMAQLYLESGNYQYAIKELDFIINEYAFDILADDAFYQKAYIVDTFIEDQDKAQKMYQEFLKRFPGSRLSAEARYRIRSLRGDILN